MNEENKNGGVLEADNSNSSTVIDESEYLDWLKFSQMDFTSAKYLFDSPLHPRPLEIICYHCQQAAEKAIKALIVYFGEPGGMPKVHNLSFLLNQIKNIVKDCKGKEISTEVYDCADRLTQYGIMPRYPNEIEVNEHMAQKAVDDAVAIIDWVNELISATDSKKAD